MRKPCFLLIALTGLSVNAQARYCEPGVTRACPDPGTAQVYDIQLPHPVDPAFDTDCGGPDRQLDAVGGSMEHVKVRDQHKLGICYSEAAVAMVDAYRFSHGDTRYKLQTSGVASAVGAGTDAGHVRTDIEGGDACTVSEHLRKTKESCSTSAIFESFDDSPYSGDIKDFTGMLVTYFKAYRDQRKSLKGMTDVLGKFELEQKRKVYTDQIFSCLKWTGYPLNQMPSRELISMLFDESNPLEYLKGLMMQACRPPRTVDLAIPSCVSPDAKYNASTNPVELMKAINDRLNQPNPQPVVIDYCAKILHDGDSPDLIHRETGLLNTKCGPHSSLVIGRRKGPGGKCQFLIRNSWGVNPPGHYSWCAKESYNLQTKGMSCDQWDSWDSSGGNLWIDADKLLKNTMGLSWLQ